MTSSDVDEQQKYGGLLEERGIFYHGFNYWSTGRFLLHTWNCFLLLRKIFICSLGIKKIITYNWICSNNIFFYFTWKYIKRHGANYISLERGWNDNRSDTLSSVEKADWIFCMHPDSGSPLLRLKNAWCIGSLPFFPIPIPHPLTSIITFTQCNP